MFICVNELREWSLSLLTLYPTEKPLSMLAVTIVVLSFLKSFDKALSAKMDLTR